MSIELSPAEALKLFEEQGREDAGEPEAKNEPDVQEPAAAEVKEPEQEQVVDAEPEGVATKDGKHVIPYSVLQSERTRAAAAERVAQEALAEVAALKASLQEGQKSTAKNGDAGTTEEPTQEDADRLALLEEDFPTVAAELKAMRELVKSFESKLKPLQESTKQAEDRRASEAAMTVQEAIDSLPKMAHIQASDKEAFDLATEFDSALRNKPEWANKPMTERFAKVVELVEATRGAIELPGAKQVKATEQEALKQAAAAKLADAKKVVPTSLSQFPAGAAAATDEVAAIEAMSHTQLASKLAGMSPKQIDAYFANL